MYVYDIVHDGTLHNGVGYPAVTEELFTNMTNINIGSVLIASYTDIIIHT